MRTTVTLDDDVAKRLELVRSGRGVGFKQALNDVLRAGLAAEDAQTGPGGDNRRTEPIALGRQLIDVTSVGTALALAEGDGHR